MVYKLFSWDNYEFVNNNTSALLTSQAIVVFLLCWLLWGVHLWM